MIILASSSPRRQTILSMLGLPFHTVKPEIDESFADFSAEAYVARLATEKATTIAEKHADKIIIAADTTVVLNEKILNKPIDNNDAQRMLSALSNNTHQVLTGFCIKKNERNHVQVVSADVTFRKITSNEIDSYIETGEHSDKAGAYAIQGIGSMFVKSHTSSHSNIMGLPIFELCEALKSFGVSPLDQGRKA